MNIGAAFLKFGSEFWELNGKIPVSYLCYLQLYLKKKVM